VQKNFVLSNAIGYDGAEISYKSGLIKFVNKLPNAEIYCGEYDYDAVSPFHYLTVQPDKVIYTFNSAVYTEDGSSEVLSLCRDPVCDHSEREYDNCFIAFGGGGNVIMTEEYIYFKRTTNVWRYSLRTMRREMYASFNIVVASLTLMGRYLYVGLPGGVYVKVDLVTDTAVALEPDIIMSMIYPYQSKMYIMDESENIYECDENFQNITLIANNRKEFDCHIQSSYQAYKGKLYYISKENDQNMLYVYELSSKTIVEKVPGVVCFAIANDIIYMQFFEPFYGPEYTDTNTGERSRHVILTGNKIYHAPINKLQEKNLLVTYDQKFDECIESYLERYYMYVTDKYLYTEAIEFFDDNVPISCALYRMNLSTKKWQRIRGEYDRFRFEE